MRHAKAIITVATGRAGTHEFPVQKTRSYTTMESIDGDVDTFSFDVGDLDRKLEACLDRDNEVRVQLFIDDLKGNLVPIFKGIADTAQRAQDMVLSLQGRDEPSSLAVDADATPFRGNHIKPESFIAQRAHAIGVTNLEVAKMSFINSLYTDGSEKEWALWYRIARTKGMYMWTNHQRGSLVIDKLGYALTPTYRFGVPPRGQSTAGWIQVEDAPEMSNKQTRKRRVIVYGEDAKKGKALVAMGVDTSIASWKKQATTIMTDTAAKNQADLKKTADEEIFESIVGAKELELTVRDVGTAIQQNKMCIVNLPDRGIDMQPWFVVGVQRMGSEDGFTQIVRLREKGFALSKRVPDAPTIKNPKDPALTKPAASIGAALSAMPGIKWADSFVQATNEYGVANGWDFALFLGVLLAMCSQESSFSNCREGRPGDEWLPYDRWLNSGGRLQSGKNAAQLEAEYLTNFANSAGNTANPFRNRDNPEAGVGPMQLTDRSLKEFADSLGWNGVAKSGEYDGGRWNPNSNIRAGAKHLIDKLKLNPPADPTNPKSIWIGVARYNGSTVYADKVKAKYDALYGSEASGAVAATKSIPTGSAVYIFSVDGHGTIELPADTPPEAVKAITWARQHLGDPYEWGGSGPHYDCSSFVTKALAVSAAYLRALVDEPVESPPRHGESTYTLFRKGRFDQVWKDNLRTGDLVFFRGANPEHVGIYVADGLFIHDPKPGDVVKWASMNDDYYRTNYTGARRLIVWPTLSPGTR